MTLISAASHFTDAHAVRAFVTAGNATLTLTSRETGTHFTYRVRLADRTKMPDAPPVWFVSVLVDGSADDGTFVYIGMIDGEGRFRLTAKSRVKAGAPSFVAFGWFWRKITGPDGGVLPASLLIQHEGRCCACGRTLTHPDSILTGWGPECSARHGVARLSALVADDPTPDSAALRALERPF